MRYCGLPSDFARTMTGICVLAATSVACGGVIRHDVDDSLYLELASQTQYDPCGMVECGLVMGSGSLIAEDWVLTAAHVVDEASGQVTFNLGGVEYEADDWFTYTDWTGDPGVGGDLALIHLSEAVTDVTPAELYHGDEEVELMTTVVGYGQTGTGLTGATESAGTKRAGNNLIGATGRVYGYSRNVMLADFDYPDDSAIGKAVCLDLEYLCAPGDSGGGWFIDVDGVTYLAGVTSFVFATDGDIDCGYGDVMAATRVGQYIDWIETYVTFTTPTIEGDLDGDGYVGSADVDIIRASWGQAVTPGDLSAGDVSGDGLVDSVDLDIVRGNWGAGVPAAVPEPGVGAMVLGIGLLVVRGRRGW